MHTLVSLLVLSAGTILQPAQPAAKPGPAAPQAAVAQPEATAQDLLEFQDARLIPAWAAKPEDRNAAISYLKAALDLTTDTRTAVGEVDWTKVGATLDASQLPESFVKASRTLREGSRQWVQYCLEGASRKACSFECSYEGGVGMLLPHLSHMRSLARALRVEARQLAVEGKRDEAARLVAAMIRMGPHVSNDRILISTLVGVAITKPAVEEASVLIAAGGLSDASRAELRAAIAAALTPDPFHGKGSLECERDMFLGWFKIALQKSDQAPRVVAALLGQQGNADVQAKLTALKGSALDADVARAREAYDELIASWDSPDAPARLTALSRRIEQGDFGLTAQITMPSFDRSWSQTNDLVKALRDTDAKLADPK